MTHTPGREIVAESIGANLEANRLVSYSGGGISMYTHCETTSIPSTISDTTERTSTTSAPKSISANRAWIKCGTEKHAPIFARGVLLDIAMMQGTKVLPPN